MSTNKKVLVKALVKVKQLKRADVIDINRLRGTQFKKLCS